MSDLSEVHVTIDDVRRAGYCVSGARRWFADHGIPFAEFIKTGMAADEFIARGDSRAARVVELKLAREATDG